MEGVRIRLADSLSHFRAVFDDSPVAIALSDDRGRFVQVNAAIGDAVQWMPDHGSLLYAIANHALLRPPRRRGPVGLADPHARVRDR